MADSGRVLYKEIRSPGRLDSVRVDGGQSAPAFAFKAAAETFARGRVAVVGSGRSSVEEQFLTRKLAEALRAPAWLVSRVGEGDGILVSADRNPNVRGALVTGLISGLPSAALDELAAQIDSGKVSAVVSVGEDLLAAGLGAERLSKVAVIYLGTHANATSEAARIVFPTLTVFEKDGTLVNQQFRIQRFARAVPGVAGAVDDLVVLAGLVAAAGGPALGGDVGSLWTSMAAEVPALRPLTYAGIPDEGLPLDPGPWSGLPFAEGASLHFKPGAPAPREAGRA
jgi:NADH-quinone oxidoreductase subunit G